MSDPFFSAILEIFSIPIRPEAMSALKTCEAYLRYLQLKHKDGTIPEEGRVRLSEKTLEIGLELIRVHHSNAADKSPTPQNTTVTIAIAGDGGKAMSGSNRSVTARDITGSSIVTGDHNTVTTTMKQVPLPPPDQVDVKAELAALREVLAGLQKVPDLRKLDRAIEDAVEETDKPEPDKEEVGGALERAVKYAKAAGDFTENVGKLLPPLTALASWLGPHWHHLFSTLPIPL